MLKLKLQYFGHLMQRADSLEKIAYTDRLTRIYNRWELDQSVVPCPVLTVASRPAYRFLRRHVRWSGIPISLRMTIKAHEKE